MKPHPDHRLHAHITVGSLAAKGFDLVTSVAAGTRAGRTPEQVADDVVDTIAAATPWSALGPVGVVIDAAEASVVKAIIHFIVLVLARKQAGQQVSDDDDTDDKPK